MREVRAKFEYVITCKCGKIYAYDKYDLTNQFRCQCGQINIMDGTHETWMLEKIRVTYERDEVIMVQSALPDLTEAV